MRESLSILVKSTSDLVYYPLEETVLSKGTTITTNIIHREGDFRMMIGVVLLSGISQE